MSSTRVSRVDVYAAKAKLYDRYRWSYHPAALDELLARVDLPQNARVADLGAGTGIFSAQLAGRGLRVLALEPDPVMACLAARRMAPFPAAQVVVGAAEHIPLAAQSLHLVCAAQAVHWFQPEPARSELRRVLRPGGWLALLRNTSPSSPLSAAVGAFHTPAHGVAPSHRAPGVDVPPGYYFGPGEFERFTFPFSYQQTWEAFLGALLSASYTPAPEQAGYAAFVAAAREVFDRFAVDGLLPGQGVTELLLGRAWQGGEIS